MDIFIQTKWKVISWTSFEFDIPQKHGNWRHEDKKAFLYIILIYGPYGKDKKKKNFGQHDGTINLNENGERIAEPNDINGLILEISFFTKMDMKTTGKNQVFSFFIKCIGNFCKRSRPPILLNLLEVLPKVILFVQG